MIPDFALLLSEDGIVLLHRDSGGDGWENIDEISLDSADLPTGMRQLCDTAHRISGGSFTTKILLPQSQLLYAEISVSNDDISDIRAALEDRTPYSADQLIFDASGTGDVRKVIAVARETLDEATGFISQFGFNPTGFSTIPPKGSFTGEPNLGDFDTTTFVPDKRAVRVIDGTEAIPESPKPEAAPEPEPLVEPEIQSPPVKEPAAFSSRRRGDEADTARTTERLSRRAPRIAIPDKDAKTAAPKVQIPLRDADQPSANVKAPAAEKPTLAPKAKTPRKSPLARFNRAKPAQAEVAQTVDPLAALAAKQNVGKPRFLGLILTAILLIALGLFAALSSYLLPDSSLANWLNGTNDTPVEVVDAADEEASDLEEFAALPEDANLPTATPEFDTLPVDQDLPPVVESPTEDTISAPSGPLDETSAQTAYVATGIWQRAPDFGRAAMPDTLDDLYVASLDPNPAFEDAPALPAQNPNSGDTRQAAPKAPPPPGVRYDLDDRGLVRPTADGALSPEGVIVFAGPPPVAPVRRDNTSVPSDLAPAIIDETEIEPQQETAILPPQTPAQTGPFADSALAGFKPRQRPSDLSERVERAQLGGRTRNELARFKPDQRPQAILDQAERVATARAAEASAQAQAIENALVEAETSAVEQERAASLIPLDEVAPDEEVDPTATALAVARSRQPAARPRGFENIVQAARRAPQPEVQTASAAARATGPAVARTSRVRPSGPTATTVARAATDNNAIALGQVSLVGVFGTASSRRALVRLPSGRFKKVSIGDRVDGGRVAAIGASELKYTKSGRTLTLKMPKG
jgi:hypothetical protein